MADVFSSTKKLIETTNQDIYRLINKCDIDMCGQICDAMELITEKFLEAAKERR